MADDFPAELERAYLRIEDLEQQLRIAKLFERKLRNKAWWKTYNAAVGPTSALEGMDIEDTHGWCSQLADRAHGPIDGHTE